LVQQHAKNTIAVVEAFGATVSSYAEATNSIWPNVFVPDYPGRARRLAKLTNAITISMNPIVNQKDRDSWFDFSNSRMPGMYQEAIEFEHLNTTVEALVNASFPFIWEANETGVFPSDRPGPAVVNWQSDPRIKLGFPLTNINLLSNPRMNAAFQSTYSTKRPTLDFVRLPVRDSATGDWEFSMGSQLVQPIFETMADLDGTVGQENKVVAIMFLLMDWTAYFENLLPPDVEGITLVLSSTCSDDEYTYQLNGNEAVPIGLGDLHDPVYDSYGVTEPFVEFDTDTQSTTDGVCITELQISLYPTKAFEESFYTKNATFYALGVVFIFAFTSLIFSIYDISVRRRQDMVMARVIRQDKIVANMFPSAIRDRLYGNHNMNKSSPDGLMLDDDDENREIFGSAALAELYPSVTVIFADIVGFTAWSSAREPSQVFALLEHIYNAFDKLAYVHSIFKVETVGDCYVAVCGLPEPRDDHAVQVAKFARDCLHRMSTLTSKLEVSLGPDTGDLKLRIGIHSGQVTGK
jgi:Adenylate and Guanylate cyclase catalytic domain